jgi:hypothetical protein
MQQDLETQEQRLGHIITELEDKKQLAERYQILANTEQKAFQAFWKEMEEALRKELTEQASKGKHFRQVASFIVWFITLVAGAAIGAYFKEILIWFKEVFT